VTGSHDGTARVWDLITHRQIGQPLETIRAVMCVAICDLGEYSIALTGCDDGSVLFWDLSTGRQTRPLRGHTNAVTAVTTYELADDMPAVTASADGTVRVWELASGRQRGVAITGHGGGVADMKCPELHGRPVLVTAGDDSRAGVGCRVDVEADGDVLLHGAGHLLCGGDRLVPALGADSGDLLERVRSGVQDLPDPGVPGRSRRPGAVGPR
jgi:WD40 repeat protein